MPFLTIDTPIVYSLNPKITMRNFSVRVETENRDVYGVVWYSRSSIGMRPLLLVGHEEGGQKNSEPMINLVRLMVGKYGFVVAIIDGPIHGERRFGIDNEQFMQMEFAQLWQEGDSIDPMVLDWQLTLNALCELPEVDARYIGYYGLSMGTAYGIPLVAKDFRISAAVFGMWGTGVPLSNRLLKDASRINCPVLYQIQEIDQHFTTEQQQELFNAMRSNQKELKIFSSNRLEPNSEQLEVTATFFITYLLDKYLY